MMPIIGGILGGVVYRTLLETRLMVFPPLPVGEGRGEGIRPHHPNRQAG
ncbi:hypothetical protein ACVXG7_15900 [Enterobacter hormaechei]